MPDDPLGLPLHWPHHLEDMLGLVIVAAVVGAYSLLFAFTRRPWQGWAITAFVAFAIMTALIWASPPQASCGEKLALAKAGVGTGFLQERCDHSNPPSAPVGASIPDG